MEGLRKYHSLHCLFAILRGGIGTRSERIKKGDIVLILHQVLRSSIFKNETQKGDVVSILHLIPRTGIFKNETYKDH